MLSCVKWLFPLVVPANAGTHTPRPLLCEQSQPPCHTDRLRGMGPCVRRDDMDRYGFAFSRRDAPGVLLENLSPPIRGRREDRVRAAPAVSRANVHQKNAHTSIQVWRKPPAFPAQWLYGLYEFAPVTGFLATVICESFGLPRNLTPTPGRQAHTTSPYALATLVFVTFASIASHPASVTIAKRPPSGTGPRWYIADLGSRSSKISENQKLEPMHLPG